MGGSWFCGPPEENVLIRGCVKAVAPMNSHKAAALPSAALLNCASRASGWGLKLESKGPEHPGLEHRYILPLFILPSEI